MTEPEHIGFRAGDLAVAALVWGEPMAPLALCLHGYPDTAWTWRHLGPALAADGYRVVAPFLRGYAPTALAPDGCYQVGALVRDVVESHATLGGDGRAVLIGHDWGAIAAHAAAAHAPERWTRVVALAVPPLPVLLAPLRSPALLARTVPEVVRQLGNSWYVFYQQIPGLAERRLPSIIDRLWRDWSPGFDAREDLLHVAQALDTRARRTAALRYYRAFLQPWYRRAAYASEQRHLFDVPVAPTLYLHGERDGCLRPSLARDPRSVLGPGSEFAMVPGAGHFLQLERPDAVNALIRRFVATS